MATVTFSVPRDVLVEFDQAFEGRDKGAIIADLMRRAVTETRRQVERDAIFRSLIARRPFRPAASDRAIAAARRRGRP